MRERNMMNIERALAAVDPTLHDPNLRHREAQLLSVLQANQMTEVAFTRNGTSYLLRADPSFRSLFLLFRT